MTPGLKRTLATIAWLLAIVVLGLTGVNGIQNGIAESGDATTLLQRSVTIGVLLYGIFGIAGAVGLAMRRRWSRYAALAWGVVTTYVPPAAVIGFGGAEAGAGAAVAAGVGSGIVCALTVWIAFVSTRASAGRARLADAGDQA